MSNRCITLTSFEYLAVVTFISCQVLSLYERLKWTLTCVFLPLWDILLKLNVYCLYYAHVIIYKFKLLHLTLRSTLVAWPNNILCWLFELILSHTVVLQCSRKITIKTRQLNTAHSNEWHFALLQVRIPTELSSGWSYKTFKRIRTDLF
jgi:hypothetical protein